MTLPKFLNWIIMHSNMVRWNFIRILFINCAPPYISHLGKSSRKKGENYRKNLNKRDTSFVTPTISPLILCLSIHNVNYILIVYTICNGSFPIIFFFSTLPLSFNVSIQLYFFAWVFELESIPV